MYRESGIRSQAFHLNYRFSYNAIILERLVVQPLDFAHPIFLRDTRFEERWCDNLSAAQNASYSHILKITLV